LFDAPCIISADFARIFEMNALNAKNHGGLLIPFDLFRLSQLAAIIGEILAGKARNILDAKLVVSRHPEAPLLLARIKGQIVENEGSFWRENADLAPIISQLIPHQVFLYYVEPDPQQRREGFVVAQAGRLLASSEATPDRLPPNAAETDWPVGQLCQKLRIPMDELADGFPSGPRVEIPLLEPRVDDEVLLKTLADQLPGISEAAPEAPQPAAPVANSRSPAAGAPGQNRGPTIDDDAKRRAKERAVEVEQQAQRAERLQSELRYAIDDLGAVVHPDAQLAEAELLDPYIVADLEGDLPRGLPRELADSLAHKRIDVAVVVEFMSEVFVDNKPLSRPVFRELCTPRKLQNEEVQQMEVLGPRLGYGTLLSDGTRHIFVSRRSDMPLPEVFLVGLLKGN
jgi:hypothetical protein